jgi:hypothetical protein
MRSYSKFTITSYWIRKESDWITSFRDILVTRYKSIDKLEKSGEDINLLKVENTFGKASQPAIKLKNKRFGGTIYTSFNRLTRHFYEPFHNTN